MKMTKQGQGGDASEGREDGPAGQGLKSKTIRLDVEAIRQLEALAEARGMTFSAVLRAAGEVYLAREVFSVGLAEVEERIGATLTAVMKDTDRILKENRRLSDDLQLSIAYIDQLTKFLLQATPEIIDKSGAVALGKRRYEGFLAEFHKSFNNRLGQSQVAQELGEFVPGQ